MRKVSIYDGPGVSSESLKHLKHVLKNYQISLLGPKEVCAGLIEGTCFILPGGRDLPYVRSLKGEGVRQIREFVEQGGNFLGICAGSYFAGSKVEFAIGTDNEVVGERELKFYSGKVVGPHLAPYDYRSLSGARVDLLKWEKEVPVFFNGGGTFIGGESHTLASYSSGEPAIIWTEVKKGRACLSGVHFEYHPDLMEMDPQLKLLKEKMDIPSLEELQLSIFKMFI